MKIINKTANGKIFKCKHCEAIHVEYKNFNFNLTERQLVHFTKYLSELDGPKWEERNRQSPYARKIIIPTQDSSINMLLNNDELIELIALLKNKKVKRKPSNVTYRLLVVTNLN